MLRAFQQACEQAVRRFDGTVVQCNEEGLLACFGYPVAYEDAARRAARTGLGLLEDMKALASGSAATTALELNPWVGIHTGPAVVEAGEESVSLVGEARNVAVRLEDVAEPGQVVCTAATHRLIRGQFDCTSLGHRKIKGVVAARRALPGAGSRRGPQPHRGAEPAGLTPLTGRDHEISLLKDRWEQAQEGMGQVVLLIGEPGLGKSRLVHTLKEHVLGQMVEGRGGLSAVPSSSGAARRTSRTRGCTRPSTSTSGPSASAARSRRRPGSTGCSTAWSSMTWPGRRPCRCGRRCCRCRPRTAFPPFRCRRPGRGKKRSGPCWSGCTRAPPGRPILFVVEDLHWVDASTLEFLGQFLAEGLHDPILTLLTFRPEFQTPWPAVAHQTSLALNRLTRRQVGDLMRQKTGAAVPEAVIDQIYDRTGGVPLFVEEFTKMVQESDALHRAGEGGAPGQGLARARDPHHAPGPGDGPAGPDGGRAGGGPARRGPRPRVQLRAARRRRDLDEPTLQAELAKLVQAEILYPKGRPPRCTYIFKHALLEDALYNALVKGKRQQLHRRIAEVLEARFPQTVETQPELLAHHFTEAGLTEQAVGYWLKAGLRSRERAADREAIGHLTKGLALLETLEETREHDEQKLKILTTLGPAYIAVRGYAAPEVGPILLRARELCQRIGDEPQLFGIMLGRWEWHLVRGDLRPCVGLAADGMALAERLDDPGMLMEALFMPGATMFYRAQFAEARACYEKAVAAYDDRERTRFWTAYTGHNAGVTHRCYLALALWHLGYPDQALRLDRETHELARTIGHAFSLGHAVDFTAFLYHYCRLGAEVQAAAEEEMAIGTEQGFQLWHALGTLHKGAGMLLQGRREEALPLLLKGFSAFRATGAEVRVPSYLGMLGDAYTQSGRFEDAHKALNEGLAVAEKNDDRCHEAELHRLKGELLLAESPDQIAAAEDCFRRAIETARRQQSKAWELRATMSLARLWQRQGRRDEPAPRWRPFMPPTRKGSRRRTSWRLGAAGSSGLTSIVVQGSALLSRLGVSDVRAAGRRGHLKLLLLVSTCTFSILPLNLNGAWS